MSLDLMKLLLPRSATELNDLGNKYNAIIKFDRNGNKYVINLILKENVSVTISADHTQVDKLFKAATHFLVSMYEGYWKATHIGLLGQLAAGKHKHIYTETTSGFEVVMDGNVQPNDDERLKNE